MFERFTDRARRVVVLAQEEAKMINHNYIGTEHILLGLIHEGEGVAAQALQTLGISLDNAREQVLDIIGRGPYPQTGHIPFTPRAKKVLELALREALQLGHSYIGTEHILLGLIREGEGVAAQVLDKLGADLNRVRQQVIQLLSGNPAPVAAPKPKKDAYRVVATINKKGKRVSINIDSNLPGKTKILGVSVRYRDPNGVIGIHGQEWPEKKRKKSKKKRKPDKVSPAFVVSRVAVRRIVEPAEPTRPRVHRRASRPQASATG